MRVSTSQPRILQQIAYEEAAQDYLRSLPLKHFMESTAQSTQRKITDQSFDSLHHKRSDLQLCGELLLHYPYGRSEKLRQVVPDHVLFVCDHPIEVKTSYNVPLQPVGPFWVMEYVSQSNKRKDYADSFKKYERELKVPYYLLFNSEEREIALLKRGSRKYRTIRPDEEGRYAIPELEMEVGLLDGWVRFWYRGRLLPLTADLTRELQETRLRLAEAQRRAEEQTRRAEEQARRADDEARRADAAEQEVARLRAELARKSSPRKNGS